LKTYRATIQPGQSVVYFVGGGGGFGSGVGDSTATVWTGYATDPASLPKRHENKYEWAPIVCLLVALFILINSDWRC